MNLTQLREVEGLDDNEREKLNELLNVWSSKLPRNRLRTCHYEAKEGIKNLGIAIPDDFANIDLALGWSAKAVDLLAARSIFDGFVYEGEEIEALERIVDDNKLINAYEQATQSELINCCAFGTVMRGGDNEPPVVINFHSAENSAALWDFRKKRISWGLVVSDMKRNSGTGKLEPTCVMMHNDKYVYEFVNNGSRWVVNKLPHIMGKPLIVPMPYRPSLKRPFGKSRISRAVMSISACAIRARLRAELGSEFYTVPQKYLLGASDDDFDREKWETYIGSIFTASKDEDGDVPKFGQLPQASMQPHTEYMRDLAAQFSGETSIPISSLGVIHDNPASAEAIYAAKEDLVIEAQSLNRINGEALCELAKMALCIDQNKPYSLLTDEEKSIQAHFKNPALPSIVSQADAMVKVAASAPWVAESEVFFEEVGFDDATRKRLMSDKAKIEAKAMLQSQMQQPQKKEATMYQITSILQKFQSGRLSRAQAIKMFAKIGIDEEEALDLMEDADADSPTGDRQLHDTAE